MQRQEYVKINGVWTTRYVDCGKRRVNTSTTRAETNSIAGKKTPMLKVV